MRDISKRRKAISKVAAGDQHGIFQHFQSNVTDYATRERYLSLRGGEAPIGRDTDSLYNIAPEGEDSRVPTEYVAPHLSTRYSPDRVGVQAQRVADGVYQDPYTNKVYDYNEGFKTEDGRSFPGGSASLQSSLMRLASILDEKGMHKEADKVDGVLRKVASFIPSAIDNFRAKITGGRFKGGVGMVTHEYNDGVFGLDLDEPMHGSERGFAAKDEIEMLDDAGTWTAVPSDLGSEDLSELSDAETLRLLVAAHRDPSSSYKLTDDRLAQVSKDNLTEEEKAIVLGEKISESRLIKGLVSVASSLDNLGFSEESDIIDSSIKAVAYNKRDLSKIIDLATALDEKGLGHVSDHLDLWVSRNS